MPDFSDLLTAFTMPQTSIKQNHSTSSRINATASSSSNEVKFSTVFTDCITERSSFILDLSYLLYYGHFRGNGQPWVDTRWVEDIVLKLLNNGHEVYIAVDGKPVRKQMSSSYKSNRKHTYNIRENMPPLLFNLKMCKRVHIHYNPALEADDVIFTLNALLPGKKVIVSSDNDMLQCLGSDTIIDTGKTVLDAVNYLDLLKDKFHGVPVQRLPMYRSIVGDSSDNIKPPVARFPHALAARIAKELEYDPMSVKFPSKEAILKSVWKMPLSSTDEKWIRALTDDTVPKKKVVSEEDLSLIPEELRTSPESTTSPFNRWSLSYELMRLHAYTLDEISYEPENRYEDLPSEIVNTFGKIFRADSMYTPLHCR